MIRSGACSKLGIAKSTALTLALALAAASAAPLSAAGIGTLARNKVYSVNIIAYENCPKTENSQRIAVKADFTDTNVVGNTKVNLTKTNKIFLTPGETFRVLRSNACNTTTGARLQLPPETGDEFQVWVRLVGPPDSSIDVFLCAVDPDTDLIVCDSDHLAKTRLTGKGEPSFTDATNALLRFGALPLFDEGLEDYFWSWNTSGKPHAQVWFVDPD